MKTILVVDDSAICREPMAATLRLQGYQTLEAANGQEALQIAQTQKPDLILLDVTMPVMDGLTCLGELRRRSDSAKIPVIMLTGTSDRKVIIQAAQKGIAGFLLKTSFSISEMIARVHSVIGEPENATITQSVATAMTPETQTVSASANAGPCTLALEKPTKAPANRLTKSEVLDRLNQEIELKSISHVLEYVIALTRSSASTFEEITLAIRQDQALALHVLRAANSSFYQRGRGAKNLMEATQRIGMTALRNTVIAILAIEHFEQSAESGLIPQRFWEHSLATGVLAEMIGVAVSSKATDQLFLAGLLHDVGRMVLSTIYPKEYAAAIAWAELQNMDVELVEREVFELSHVDVTRHLLSRWNMHPSIIEAASLHESPIGTLRGVQQDAQSILAVALANRLAHALLSGNSGNARLLPYYDVASELGLDSEAIAKLTTAAHQKMADTEMFYVSQSSEPFCDPLAVELAKKAPTLPRIVVFGPDSPTDPFSLFFKQLGWLEPERPTAVLLFARSQRDFTRYLPALRKLDAAGHGTITVIVATAGESMSVPAEWSCNRRVETISLPCAYSRLVEAVVRDSEASQPARTMTASCQHRNTILGNV
jgi:HD-like signal output (HDOD) protein/FixJ family two-component response regulator